jgi:uncharacterized membrane protein
MRANKMLRMRAHHTVRRNLKTIIMLSLIAMIISGYLLSLKYHQGESPCHFSDEISCDVVSKSPYSEFPPNSGIPIAGLGIIAFLLYLIPAALLLSGFNFKHIGLSQKKVHLLMFVWGAFSIFFYIYLTYLELFVIYALCPLCTITFALTVIIFLLIVQNLKAQRRIV